MKRSRFILGSLVLSSLSAMAAVQGDVSTFTSSRGLTEQCIAVAKLPGAVYAESDLKKEKEFCSLNFYDNSVILCPKTWSTSPGTIVRDNSQTGKNYADSEARNCARKTALDNIAKFKQSMHRPNTSGTYSKSSLLYYHLSRFLNATVDVPVAVYRTMDKDTHYQRVSSKVPNMSGMIGAGWDALKQAEKNPATYVPTEDLFTDENRQIYGVLLKDKGERYGVEFNGTRASGWGLGQNMDFQKTPAFEALKSTQPIRQAIQTGLAVGMKNPGMAKAFAGSSTSEVQMVLWMRELTEIAILDHILSQQDRIGNIDYRWFWVFKNAEGQVMLKKEDSELPRTQMGQIKAPAAIAAMNPVLVQKTSIGDNDAGGSAKYANFAKRAGMVANIRHIHPETYRAVVRLASDFSKAGEISQALQKNFGLKTSDFNMLSTNTREVATILVKACESQQLKFDLVTYKEAYRQEFTETSVNCQNP